MEVIGFLFDIKLSAGGRILRRQLVKRRVKQVLYDILIVGGGPAGLTAGIYGARGGRKVALIERAVPGGQAFLTNEIENYPGFPKGISGPELMQAFQEQAERFGVEIITGNIQRVQLDGEEKLLIGEDGSQYRGRSVIIASGAQPKKLGVPGEEEFRGRGVSYCATCDGAFFRNKKVAVVGGGDAAVEEAIFLTRFARQVVIIHRRNRLRAVDILQKRAMANEKIDFRWDTVVKEISGQDKLASLKLKNVKTGEEFEEAFDGLFVFIGTVPNTEFLQGALALDEEGWIITNSYLGTSQKGVFAAGDVRNTLFRQVATAVGDGAIAAASAEHYLAGL
ncbi:MAG: thioredoxin-disulfide reductase [Clostridia bacterium]|jgi:thioredoxin reductase (NADPH)|nr:thioredoxin-disulfide reductase [Clostridia bacterium]